jgi:hypothetical protein
MNGSPIPQTGTLDWTDGRANLFLIVENPESRDPPKKTFTVLPPTVEEKLPSKLRNSIKVSY